MKPKNVDRVIFCSGKVYYDLIAYFEANRVNDAALVRVEQLYPLNLERLEEAIGDFRHASKWIWCQEEPRNMGAWTYIAPLLGRVARQDARICRADRLPLARLLDPKHGTINSRRSLFIRRLPCNRWLLDRIHLLSMSIEVKIPAVGESITSGVLSVVAQAERGYGQRWRGSVHS